MVNIRMTPCWSGLMQTLAGMGRSSSLPRRVSFTALRRAIFLCDGGGKHCGGEGTGQRGSGLRTNDREEWGKARMCAWAAVIVQTRK